MASGCARAKTKSAARAYLPLLVIMVLGSTLRFLRIGEKGLWIDEAFSIWLARRPWPEMISWVATVDQHPPLYYTLLGGWVRVFGDGEASARSLSALIGTLTLPVAYLLGRRVGGEKVGLLSGLILAVSPFHVQFGQEARMYALLTLSGSLALYAAVALLGRGGGALGSDREGHASSLLRQASARLDGWSRCPSPGRRDSGWLPWMGYVFCTAAMLWTHNAAVLFPIALNLYVLGRMLRRKLPKAPASLSSNVGDWRTRWWLLAQALVVLLWLPWLPTFASQAAGVYHRFWLPALTLETTLGVLGEFLCAFLPLSPAGIVVVDVALFAVALLGLRQLRHRPEAAMLGMVFAAPLLGECVVSIWRPILYTRTLIWASIPLYLMLATGLCTFQEKLSCGACLLAALMIVLGVNGLALHSYYADFEKEGWDSAAALVTGQVRTGDLLLFNDAWGQIPFDYYFRRLYNRQVVEHGLPVDLFDGGVLEPRMTEDDLPRMDTLVAGRERVWLITSHEWYTDPEGLIPTGLGENLSVLHCWEFYRVRVSLYGRRAGLGNGQG